MKKKSLDQNISMFQSAKLNRITRLHKRYKIHILDQQCVCMTTEFIYTAIQQQQNKKYRTQREKRAVTEFGSSFFSHLFIFYVCVLLFCAGFQRLCRYYSMQNIVILRILLLSSSDFCFHSFNIWSFMIFIIRRTFLTIVFFLTKQNTFSKFII